MHIASTLADFSDKPVSFIQYESGQWPVGALQIEKKKKKKKSSKITSTDELHVA